MLLRLISNIFILFLKITAIAVVILFFCVNIQLSAQNAVSCNNSEIIKKITIKPEVVNSETRYINLNNEEYKPHSVYQLSLSDRVKKGYSVISKNYGLRSLRTPTYTITFLDEVQSTGTGFNDPSLGATRKQTFETALTNILAMITNTGSVDIQVDVSENEGKGALASAGPYPTPASTGYSIGAVAKHVILGKDPYPSFPDAEITFDFGFKWNNTMDNPDFEEYDMYTVALHELIHCFGFSSYIGPDGTSIVGEEGYYTLYDQFIINKDYNQIVGGEPPVLNTSTDDLTSNGLKFGYLSGSIAPVYSPSPYTYGSSCSHVDHSRISGVTYVMHPSLTNGTMARVLHADEINVLSSLGYGIESEYLYTSVNEVNSLEYSNIKMYPNPAYVFIKIEWPTDNFISDKLNIKISNILGKEVMNSLDESGNIDKKNSYAHINISSLPNGIYFLILNDNEKTVTKRLIKK